MTEYLETQAVLFARECWKRGYEVLDHNWNFEYKGPGVMLEPYWAEEFSQCLKEGGVPTQWDDIDEGVVMVRLLERRTWR